MTHNLVGRVLVFLCAAGMLRSAAGADEWTLWADHSNGLPDCREDRPLKFPRLAFGAGHTFYISGSTSETAGFGGEDGKGRVWKGSSDPSSSAYKTFTLMPQDGLEKGSIRKILVNATGQVVVATGHGSGSHDSVIYRFDEAAKKWLPAELTGKGALWGLGIPPGGLALAPNGTIWACANFSGSASSLYKSTDGGSSFSCVNVDKALPGGCAAITARKKGAVFGIGFSVGVSPKGTIYLGSEGGGFVCSEDDGATWQSVDPNYANPKSQVKCGWANNCYGIGFTKDGKLLAVGGLNSIPTLPFSNVGTDLYLYDPATRTDQFVHITPGALQYQATDTQTFALTASGENFIFLVNNGVWRSPDGMEWKRFDTGITIPTFKAKNGLTSAFCGGAIAADGNDVFAATADGRIWHYNTGIRK